MSVREFFDFMSGLYVKKNESNINKNISAQKSQQKTLQQIYRSGISHIFPVYFHGSSHHLSPNGNPWDFWSWSCDDHFEKAPFQHSLVAGGLAGASEAARDDRQQLGKFHHDLTSRPLGIMVFLRVTIPKWSYFRLVNYYNLPRYIYLTKYLVGGLEHGFFMTFPSYWEWNHHPN